MRRCFLTLAILCAAPSSAFAVDVPADPTNYIQALGTLNPGDRLVLAPGEYLDNLDIAGLDGTEAAPIIIEGPANGGAVFLGNGCCNTVEISDSSYVVVRSLTIDGQGIDGVFGVSAKSGVVHHITIENCSFKGQGAGQQTVGISTKVPTYGWVIRRNVIDGAGTGFYLGDSNGAQPFVQGLIEFNLIEDTIGYNGQIKHQNPWPTNAGLPTGKTSTIIRHNVFIKNDAPSPDGDRPNLLVGGFPESGPGADNLYEIYGNFFFHNPRESLIQASGQVSIHDNVLVDAADVAIYLTNQELGLRRANVYNNTIYGANRGIYFANAAELGDFVVGNLIFASTPLEGPIDFEKDNLGFAEAMAATIVKTPSLELGVMDFVPLDGQAVGPALDLSSVALESRYDVDFNGLPKANDTDEIVFRGAYAVAGDNPGWQLDRARKTLPEGAQGGGGSGSGGSGGDDAGPSGGPSSGSGDNDIDRPGNCTCGVVGGSDGGSALWFVVVGLMFSVRGFWNSQRRIC